MPGQLQGRAYLVLQGLDPGWWRHGELQPGTEVSGQQCYRDQCQCYVGSPWCGYTHWPVVTTLLMLARWRQQSVMCNMSMSVLCSQRDSRRHQV